MGKTLLAMATMGVLSTMGCGGGASTLVGVWEVDVDRLKAQLGVLPEDSRDAKMMARAIESMKTERATWEFRADGTVVLSLPAGQSENGQYKVVASAGDTVTINVTIDNNNKNATIKFLDHNTIEMSTSDTKVVLPLHRAK